MVYCSAATNGASTSASSQTRRDLQGRRRQRQSSSGREQFGLTYAGLAAPVGCCSGAATVDRDCGCSFGRHPCTQTQRAPTAPATRLLHLPTRLQLHHRPACTCTTDQPAPVCRTAAPVKRVWVLGGEVEHAHQPLLHIHRRSSHGARAALVQRAPVGKVGASVVAGQSKAGAEWAGRGGAWVGGGSRSAADAGPHAQHSICMAEAGSDHQASPEGWLCKQQRRHML